MTPPIRVRRRWHPDADHEHGADPLSWHWTCNRPTCPHTRLDAYSRTRQDAQREADAHVYVAAIREAQR